MGYTHESEESWQKREERKLNKRRNNVGLIGGPPGGEDGPEGRKSDLPHLYFHIRSLRIEKMLKVVNQLIIFFSCKIIKQKEFNFYHHAK